jgi:hypothetical protein
LRRLHPAGYLSHRTDQRPLAEVLQISTIADADEGLIKPLSAMTMTATSNSSIVQSIKGKLTNPGLSALSTRMR